MTGPLTTDRWSSYDDAVPHTTGLPQVVDRAATLRTLRRPCDGASVEDVRQVVVVVSSSRGGSSLVGQLMRQVPGLLHLRAEVNPLFTLAGLHAGANRRRVLEEELLRDIGTPVPPGPLESRERSRLVLDLAWRLMVQWPSVAESLPLEELLSLVDRSVPRVGSAHDAVAVQIALLTALRQAGAPVHPGYYDLPPSAMEALDGWPAFPAGPPGDAVIEMPPFVTLGRWQPASATQVRSLPLVLCTPRCSFRLEFIRDLFPSADLRIVHLTRNPAASVNGLIDGWLHHGFFNCRVPGGLAIDGYSDTVPGGSEWWCFDPPPGWEECTSAPLPEVCAFQWRETHLAAMTACYRLGIEPLHIRFEDVVGPREARLGVATRLAGLLGVDGAAVRDALGAHLPVVMATAPPSSARWRRRADLMRPVLSDPTWWPWRRAWATTATARTGSDPHIASGRVGIATTCCRLRSWPGRTAPSTSSAVCGRSSTCAASRRSSGRRPTGGWSIRSRGLLTSVCYAQWRAGTPQGWPHARRIGVATAATLLAIDLVYVSRGRIRWAYLVDAVAEAALIAGWAATSRQRTGT
jgi:hypothetical protein